MINAQLYDPYFNSAGAYSGQGAYADPGNNCWSSVQAYASGDPHSVPATPLYTSTGAPTSVTFACSNVRGGWWNEAIPTDLLGIGCYTQSDQPTLLPDPATFTIGGLTPGGTYSIYLYAVGDAANSQGTIFSFDGFATSQTCTGTATSGFVLGANYVVVRNLKANPSGQIVGQWKDNGHTYAPFNGFQLISASVPEPGTLTPVHSRTQETK